MRTPVGILALLAVLSAAAVANARDLTLRQRTTMGAHSPKAHEVMEYWSGSKMVTDDPQQRTIVDMDTRTFTVVEKDKQTYFTETFDEMQRQAESMKQAMQKRFENLPPQAKEMMGNLTMDAAVSVKATGKHETIAGYDAKEYTIEGGPMTASVWVSEALQPPVPEEKAVAFRKAMSGMAGPGGKLAAAMVQLKGLPLRTTVLATMGPQRVATTTEVIEISEKAPPPEVMNVPAGFKQVAPPSFDMPERGGPPQHP